MRTDLDKFDLVIVMNRSMLNDLTALHSSPSAKLRLLSDFLPEGSPTTVPDPMYSNRAVCHGVFNMLDTACPKIIEELCETTSFVKRRAL